MEKKQARERARQEEVAKLQKNWDVVVCHLSRPSIYWALRTLFYPT